MPKKGYTQIIVSNEVREILQKTARESGFRTVNEMLKHLIETAIFSRVNPGVNPRSTLTHYNTTKLNSIQPLNPQNNLKQAASLKQSAFHRSTCEARPQQPVLAGPRGFEPRTSGSAGQRLNPS